MMTHSRGGMGKPQSRGGGELKDLFPVGNKHG